MKLFFVFFAILPVLFWSVRSTIILKKPVIVSTNGGVNMILGNNSYICNGRSAVTPSKEYLVYNQFKETTNEVEVDSQYRKIATKWIVKNPIKFIQLSFSKIRYIFSPNPYIYSEGYNIGSFSWLSISIIYILIQIYFYTLLFFSLLGFFYFPNKRWLLFILPYIFMVILSFADGRFFIPLFFPLTILSSFAFVNIKKVTKNKMILLIAAFLVFAQICYFYPSLEQNLFLGYDYLLKRENWQSFDSQDEKYLISDYAAVSHDKQIIVKKHKIGENEDQFFVNSQGVILDENQIYELINNGKLYTDVSTIFSKIDKKIYPNLYEKNYLEYFEGNNKPVFKVLSENQVKSEGCVLDSNLSSDWPNERKKVFSQIVDADKRYLISYQVRSKSKIIIKHNGKKITLTNYNDPEAGEIHLIFPVRSNESFDLYLQPEFAFANTYNFNIFTGGRRSFDPNDANIKSIIILKNNE